MCESLRIDREVTVRRKPRSRWSVPATVSTLTFLLAACAQNAPQDALKPEGPIARQVDGLFKPVFWIAVVIFVLVEGALVYFAWRFRERKGVAETPPQLHGHKKLEIAWTIAPALLLAGIAVPTVVTIWDLNEAPAANAVEVQVIGHQWWWEYNYTDLGVTTANELHIPVGTPVRLTLESADVIHSFWVPKLVGKQDLVPGRKNTMNLEADKPGTYFGQCAEFCSLSHANMRLRVIAEPQDDFDRWVADQRSDAVLPSGGASAAGMREFLSNVCIQCHTVRGTKASFGKVGPDLTHFMSRTTFGAATYDNTVENLESWLRDPQAAKPGNKMVIPKLTEDQIAKLVAFLRSLK